MWKLSQAMDAETGFARKFVLLAFSFVGAENASIPAFEACSRHSNSFRRKASKS
jgi:hypothetical protein